MYDKSPIYKIYFNKPHEIELDNFINSYSIFF